MTENEQLDEETTSFGIRSLDNTRYVTNAISFVLSVWDELIQTKRTIFDGKALAIVRPLNAGTITVTVTADGCGPKTIQLNAAD